CEFTPRKAPRSRDNAPTACFMRRAALRLDASPKFRFTRGRRARVSCEARDWASRSGLRARRRAREIGADGALHAGERLVEIRLEASPRDALDRFDVAPRRLHAHFRRDLGNRPIAAEAALGEMTAQILLVEALRRFTA